MPLRRTGSLKHDDSILSMEVIQAFWTITVTKKSMYGYHEVSIWLVQSVLKSQDDVSSSSGKYYSIKVAGSHWLGYLTAQLENQFNLMLFLVSSNPTPSHSSSAKDEILGLSQVKLQEMLTKIIEENDSIRHECGKKASVKLRHVIPYHTSIEIELDENAMESHLGLIDVAASKVLISRFAICEFNTCGKMFDVSSNSGRLFNSLLKAASNQRMVLGITFKNMHTMKGLCGHAAKQIPMTGLQNDAEQITLSSKSS
ncbi:predicted protein [Sclerotinia sclerotiorum 1980 UF-70]|uniref:Uncharacterized protein n=1 Tax=Sclerotinia sclerotiorum (strain ATCC 18683 / 1980 / Ss-1) TaxID=665079 RepID=A7EEY9_SCLS1|nr:predicted protein [Sclerotinia sclerotiorum 1980 UF-70]EDO01405.1 predicted protein [Sclerotinia sclerotiorum 1980 UF-70]